VISESFECLSARAEWFAEAPGELSAKPQRAEITAIFACQEAVSIDG
jgi:hypothetical protein